MARTYDAIYPKEKDRGSGQMQLGRALALSGRYDEAVGAATAAYNSNPKQWASDAGFCQRYAALMSLTNQLALVGNWLTQAYKDGYSNIAYIRQSPDLAHFRNAQPQLFARLTTVQWRWQLDTAMYLHDVTVQNDSPFDLTNVIVDVSIRKDSELLKGQAKCATIRSGNPVWSKMSSAFSEIPIRAARPHCLLIKGRARITNILGQKRASMPLPSPCSRIR